jgi:hypothetical protein
VDELIDFLSSERNRCLWYPTHGLAPARDLDEEPPPPSHDVAELLDLGMTSVKAPGHREIKLFISRLGDMQVFVS